MKNKLVIWGTNAEKEKVLIAIELQADANKVMLYTFPEAIASEEFVNKMMEDWRVGKPVEFPEGHSSLERELSMADSLLPEGLQVERPDLIQRAQTEWHFAVLSAKLHLAYQEELADFKEKVRNLTAYDNATWDSLKGFWDKVQEQSRERNLFREHADNLRDNINKLFDELKKMRTRVQDEFVNSSQKVFDEFSAGLDDVEKRIAAGGSKLNSVFDDLKVMQRKYREARMSNEHRNQLWERLDGAFKSAKERKFGPKANEGSVVERHERRIEGLNEAIKRMEDGIRRDDDELAFQRKKVATTEGQLEAQIRSAKIKMVEERVASKREKLNEMLRTRDEVSRQIGSAKDKEQKRKQFDAAKEAAKTEIASSIKSKSVPAAPDVVEIPAEETSTGTSIGDLLMEAVEKVKSIGEVVVEMANEAIDEGMELAANAAGAFEKKDESTTTAEAPAPVVEAEPIATAEATTPVAEAPVAEAAAEATAEPVATTETTDLTEEPATVVDEVVAEATVDQDEKPAAVDATVEDKA
jgi:hypothetical protein